MATSMKKNTPIATDVNETISSGNVNDVEEIPTMVAEKVKVTPKKFKETDAIDCVSITAGEMGMIGIKSNINYTWAGRGDVTAVEYQDLVAAIRSGKKHIYAPYFIIKDDDFLALFPQVADVYSSMLSYKDLKDILSLSVNNMKKAISELPSGAKESIKNIASSQISKGTLDSVQKIKVLDEIFDTKFMLMTELFK